MIFQGENDNFIEKRQEKDKTVLYHSDSPVKINCKKSHIKAKKTVDKKIYIIYNIKYDKILFARVLT